MFSLLLPLALLHGQEAFALHDGDRVLFYGDSITDNQFYPQFVETYVVTRFPAMRVTFMNYGWSGDKVSGGGGGDIAKRLERDVFPNHPTVVTIMLGMNDGLYHTWDDGTFRTYANGYERILSELRSHGDPKLTLIKPSPYDDFTLPANLTGGGYNVVMQKFGDYIGGLALRTGATAVDFNAPVVDLLSKAKSIDADNARKLIGDRIHPSPAVHIVMGAALLKAWNAPALVSTTKIDASNGVAITDNALVRDMRVRPGNLSWRALEGSLPVFFDKGFPGVTLVMRATNVFDDVNREPLKVNNLADGTYRLSIDGEEQGRFTDDQLSSGINLAEFNTPMMKQAATVATWTARRQFIRQTTWRNVLVAMDNLDLTQRQQAVKALEKLEAEIVDKQRQAAKPVWHRFELEKVTGGSSRRGSGKGG